MFKQILVAVDGSPTSNRGLASALALAADQKGNVLLLHVIDELAVIPPLDAGYVPANFIEGAVEGLRERGREILEEAEKQAREQGVSAKSVIADSNGLSVAHAILSQARKARADLIVLGTHGRHGVRRLLLGSDAESVLREATCPVLLVRSPEPTRSSRRKSAQSTRRPKVKAAAASRAAAHAA